MLLFFVIWKPSDKSFPPVSLVLDSDSPLSSSLFSSLLLASKEIYIELFRLTDPQILPLFYEKKKLGIDIAIFLDSKCKKDKRIRDLSNFLTIKYETPHRLMHRKLVVIDQKISWIGSFNFTRTGFYLQKNAMLRIENEDVALFLRNPNSPKFASFSIEGTLIQIWKLPPAKEALNMIRRSIQEANNSIQVALFAFSHVLLVNDLIEAHNRGVDVKVILDRGQSMGSSKKAILNLLRAGVSLFLYGGIQDLHHKFALIDQKTLFLGSCNWSKSAFSSNKELLTKLVIEDGPLKNKVNSLWEGCFSQATPIVC